jgi:hypothetical protein
MPAASLEAALKVFIQTTALVVDNNITYGTRNQSGTFPAIAYRIMEIETLTLGSDPLKKVRVEVDCWQPEAQQATDLAEGIKASLISGTYSGYVFNAVINNTNSILQEPESGDGEETNPHMAQIVIDIFYKEP